MTFANPLPWWALAVVLAAALTLAWLAYRNARTTRPRRALLAGLRFVVLLVLVILLLRPMVPSGAAGGGRLVVVLIDTSRSMAIADAGGQRRLDRARTLLQSAIAPALLPHFELEVLGFGSSVSPAVPAETLVPAGTRTELNAAVREVTDRYRGRPLAGIVLLSDGGDTGPANDSRTTAQAPVFAIPVGSASGGRDREIVSVTAAESVLDRSRNELRVSAVSRGDGVEPFQLRVLENGRPVEVRAATPASEGTPVSETFSVNPDPAVATVYTVEIPNAAGEIVPENNRRSVLVPPAAPPRRVLLVQGAPGFEHSFLQRAWSGDAGLQVDSVVRKGRNDQGSDTFYIQAGPAAQALSAGYPTTTPDLFAYHAVVLANVQGSSYTAAQLEMTREFVARRGGGLLVLGARSFQRDGLAGTALEDLLPLDPAARGPAVVPAAAPPGSTSRVSLTPDGEAHPVMQLGASRAETRKKWEAIPPLAAVSPLGAARPGAFVLAASGSGVGARPLVAVQRYGAGRTMVFTGEGAWRWRMMLPASDRSYETFWRQAARWLATPAADPVHLVPPADAMPGEPAVWQVSVRDAGFQPLSGASVLLRLTGPGGRTETLHAAPGSSEAGAGVFVARHRPAEPGIYRAVAEVRRPGAPVVTASAVALAGGVDVEMADPRVNVRVLEGIASATGGSVIEAADAGRLRTALAAAAVTPGASGRRDLWHTGWAFALIIGLLGTEWLLRRRWGLG